MIRAKVSMGQDNYISIQNTHIFINFNRKNMEHLNQLKPDNVKKVHIFITNHLGINENLRFLIERFGPLRTEKGKRKTTIILHLPAKIKELKELIDKYLEGYNDYLLIVQKCSTYFAVNSRKWEDGHNVGIKVEKNGIRPYISYGGRLLRGRVLSVAPIIEFPLFLFEVSLKENDGIFETPEMRIDPHMFKDKLIEAFKKKCPEGILKSFKNDDEIMEYITQSGEWEIKEGEIDNG